MRLLNVGSIGCQDFFPQTYAYATSDISCRNFAMISDLVYGILDRLEASFSMVSRITCTQTSVSIQHPFFRREPCFLRVLHIRRSIYPSLLLEAVIEFLGYLIEDLQQKIHLWIHRRSEMEILSAGGYGICDHPHWLTPNAKKNLRRGTLTRDES